MKKILTSTLVLAAAALTVSTVVNAAPKYEGTYVGQMAAQDARVQAAKGTEQYDAVFDAVAAEIEARLNGTVAPSSEAQPAQQAISQDSYVGQLALQDARVKAAVGTSKFQEVYNAVANEIQNNLNNEYYENNGSIPRGENEYTDGNHRPAYGEEPKSGSAVKSSTSASSSEVKPSTSASSSAKSSDSKESKETKSTDVAVKEAKKAAKAAAKEGQKVLPNTAAVK